MTEYFTEAVVLDKEELGEQDARVFLYTEKLGKVVAKITSGRKILSKLAGHLEPLNVVEVRLVERKGSGFQVADAVRIGRVGNFQFSMTNFQSSSKFQCSREKKSLPPAADSLYERENNSPDPSYDKRGSEEREMIRVVLLVKEIAPENLPDEGMWGLLAKSKEQRANSPDGKKSLPPAAASFYKRENNSPSPSYDKSGNGRENSPTKDVLRVMGFDPELAQCQECNAPRPSHFLFYNAGYLCRNCFALSGIDGGYITLKLT